MSQKERGLSRLRTTRGQAGNNQRPGGSRRDKRQKPRGSLGGRNHLKGTRRDKPKNTEKSTPGSRRVLQGPQRPLGETFTLSQLAFDSSAFLLPSVPDSDPRFQDLDTRSPVNSLPLRRYPCYPNLNSLLFPDSELQQTHSDNLHGRSKSGLNAGTFYYFLSFHRNIFAVEP